MLKIKIMENLLEHLLYNSEFTLRNENNLREVSVSLNLEDAWCVYENGNTNPILESSNIHAIIDCFTFES